MMAQEISDDFCVADSAPFDRVICEQSIARQAAFE
jgi:hypothetical protein